MKTLTEALLRLVLLTIAMLLLTACQAGRTTQRVSWDDLAAGDGPGGPDRYTAHWPKSHFLDAPRVPEEEWVDVDGHQVHLDRLVGAPGSSGDLTVVLVHGGGGHGRLLLPFAIPLANAGHTVVAPDLPHHGLTVAASDLVTFDTWVRIVSAVVDLEHARGRRVVLYGLSIGGTTAWHVAAENSRVAGVVVTTLLDLRDDDARDAAASGPFMSRVIAPLGRALPGLFDGVVLRTREVGKLDAMTPTREVVRLLAEDPRIGAVRMPAVFYRTLTTRSPTRDASDPAMPPLLLVHPGADAWTPVALSRPVFEAWGGQKRMVVLENGAHLPFEQPAFDELQRTVVAWLEVLRGDGASAAPPPAPMVLQRLAASRTKPQPRRRRSQKTTCTLRSGRHTT
jgi:alpha-beta hydrolase superfamily lysophospholipase